MSLVEVVDDLLTLEELAEHEDDPARRRSLDAVRGRLADRGQGAKVSEAAQVLGLSQPTVRAWIEAGVLEPIAGTTPVRVGVLSLADVKRALDLVRRHADARQLLVQVMRILRDRAALAGSEEGFADLAAGRVVPIGDDLRGEIDGLRRKDGPRQRVKPRSKSNRRPSPIARFVIFEVAGV
ncbi:MAG: helix-turn-helix domain-containing protein [Actinomycetota bacterium]|nr:helix-turn-helix domain-containing protein [Actinomycetota bacterium]